MLATFFCTAAAAIIAGSEHFLPEYTKTLFISHSVFVIFFLFSLFLSIQPWLWTLFFTAKSEKTPISTFALRSVLADKKLYLFSIAILVSALSGIFLFSYGLYSKAYLLGLGLILAGFIIDNLRWAFFRVQYRRSPSGLVNFLLLSMQKATRQNNAAQMTEDLEVFFSILAGYIKTHDAFSLRIFSKKISEATLIFLRSITKLNLFQIDSELDTTLLDRYNVAEAIVSKRLSWIITTACETKNPILLEEAVKICSRLFLSFHSLHESLGHLLMFTLSETILKSDIKPGDWDRDIEVTATFSEAVKSLIDISNEKQLSDYTSIGKILTILEMHMKEAFHRDKTISPAVLMQPFAEVGQLLASKKYESLPDRDMIVSNLKRILTQFSALESFSGRMGSNEDRTDTASSYHEDMPYLPKGNESVEI